MPPSPRRNEGTSRPSRRAPRETAAERHARLLEEENEIVRRLDAEFGPSLSHEESMEFLRSLHRKGARRGA